MSALTRLPLEILADIFSLLDLFSLLQVSQSSKYFTLVCANDLLNPWRSSLHRVLREPATVSEEERQFLLHLGSYSRIPRQNWVHVLALSTPEDILFNYDVPWLPDEIWHQAFMLRYLPSWTRWKRSHSWKRAFLSLLWRIRHRLNVTCTAEESWTSYLILSRQGIVNLNAASSRQFNPHAVLNIYKEQNNLSRQPSTTRLIVQLGDVRIIAIGTLGSRTSFQANRIAKEFVYPAGVYPKGITPLTRTRDDSEDYMPHSASSELGTYSSIPRIPGTPITRSMTMDPTPPPAQSSIWRRFRSGTYSEQKTSPIPHYIDQPLPTPSKTSRQNVHPEPVAPKRYEHLSHPCPIYGHREFPNYTPGGRDLRWPEGYDGTEEECWVGPMLVAALIVSHDDVLSDDGTADAGADEILKRIGAGRSRWASFTIEDLDAIAPWLDAHIEKRMEGMGLGN